METPNSNNESLEESSHFVDKNSFVEESLNNIDLNDDVQCNIVEALYKKIPESLDVLLKKQITMLFVLFISKIMLLRLLQVIQSFLLIPFIINLWYLSLKTSTSKH